MKIAILGKVKRSYEEIKIIKEAKKVFNSVLYLPIPEARIEINSDFSVKFKNEDLSDFDCILPRIPRSYRTYGFTLLSALKGKTFVPIEPMSLFNCHNKFLTLMILNEEGLPVPKTLLSEKRKIIEDSLDEIGYPVVMKLLYGSMGKGVMFADGKQSAISFMDTLERFDEPIFVEEFVPNNGEDIRIYMVDHEPIACMKRVAKEGEKRSNIGIGGKGEKYILPEKYEDLVHSASKSLEARICGLDLMESKKGPVFIEANINAQFKGLEEATKINVAKIIIEFMKSCVKE